MSFQDSKMVQDTHSISLSDLRSKIDEVDEQLAALLAKRQSLVRQAASLKHSAGEGMVSAQREISMLEHGATLEHQYELPDKLLQDIQRRILRQSYKEKGSGHYSCAYKAETSVDTQGIKQVQEQNQEKGQEQKQADFVASLSLSSSSASSKGAQCKVVLVGGAGAMARLFTSYLTGSDYQVMSIEKGDYTVDLNGQAVSDMADSRAAYLLKQANWCIVSVPIDVTERVIKTIAPYLRPDCILSDFTSIKERPLKAMLESHVGPVIGLHPMFGPDTASLVRQVIVAVEGRGKEQCRFVLEQFKLYGAYVVECSAQEHDQAMRVIQALRHFTTFAYGVFLQQTAEGITGHKQGKSSKVTEQGGSKFDENPFLKRLLFLSSPIYHLELMMVGRLFAQDPHLYCDIISASEDNLKLIRQYLECASSCLSVLEQNDRAQFISDFASTSEFFGSYASLFLKESADILAKAQDSYPAELN